MTSQTESSIELNRGLLVGGVVLISVGALIGLVGGIATSAAMIGAARSWARQLDEPPSAMARRRFAQARTAALASAQAGAQGWRQHAQNNGSSSLQSVPTDELG
jgi:hypothetical protein